MSINTNSDHSEEMYVIKRCGNSEIVSFDKILKRIKLIGISNNININFTLLTMKVIEQLYNNIETKLIDELTAQQCASMASVHPSYNKLGSAIIISNLHKQTKDSFSEVMNDIYNFKDINNIHKPILNDEFIKIVNSNKEYFDSLIVKNNDYLYDYFGFKTLEKSYLIRLNNIVVERPQYLLLRVAIAIHKNNLDLVKETYNMMSEKWFTHATPTLFNAGTQHQQLSSCYLLAMEDDSVDGIYNTLKECANISKWSGGIGLHIHNIRSKGSHIRGTNGKSNGIIPMLKVFNNTATYIDQGGGKRNGSFAIYLEPHHADIEGFLDLKKNHGDESLRARDLFYALWLSDYFMECVQNNLDWYLFCPDQTPDLSDLYGENYKNRYTEYVKEKKYKKILKARYLWSLILDAQMETGTPYLLFKDSANFKSNQKNLGTIKSSNLCCEILEYSDKDQTAVCNLASIALNKCVINTPSPFMEPLLVYSKNNCKWCVLLKILLKRKNVEFEEIILSEDNIKIKMEELGFKTLPQVMYNDELIGGFTDLHNILQNQFDFEKLHKITKIVTNNLNNIIDINYYPDVKTKRSNLLHRPIGIGVQGLADTFMMMDLPFCSIKAKELNKNIFETIYHAALEQSLEISKSRNKDMNYLIDEYKLGNWSFKENTDICQDYIIYNRSEASIAMSIMKDNDTERLLNKIRPLKNEIEKFTNLYNTGAYSSFEGSPSSKGILQFDLWNKNPSNRYKWDYLKEQIKNYGIRNSLLVAPMPTASTSQILGNNECFEPITSNIYTRRTLAGEFVVINKYLIEDLIELNMWDEELKNNIILNKGSIQHIQEIPEFIKEKYKIVWEMPMKEIINMSADRGAYICQSQSLNLWVEDPDPKILTTIHLYTWKSGLKTGIYYLRRKPRHQVQQFTINPELKSKINNINKNLDKENIEKEEEEKEEEECLVCGS